MLRNYLKTTVRALQRRKGYAFLNVAGLALGLACVLLLALFVRDELAFDDFHADADRIHRLVTDASLSRDASMSQFAATGWPAGELLRTRYPQVEALTYLRTWPQPTVSVQGGKQAQSKRFYPQVLYADSSFFDVFSFPLTRGRAEGALNAPFEVVLSADFARTVFGDAQAVGRTVALNDTLSATVTGVAEVPRRSHIQFDALVSFASLWPMDAPAIGPRDLSGGWGNINVYNYLKLREGTDAEALTAQIRDLPKEEMSEMPEGAAFQLGLEPLQDIYLHTERQFGLGGPRGDWSDVLLLGAVALFTLLLAAVNYVNLATARAAERAKEVGVRKSVGAQREGLVGQFLGESVLTALLAGVGAFALARMALPLFNNLTGKAFTSGDVFTLPALGIGLALVLAVGLLAGLYPALVLTRPRPADVLKSARHPGRSSAHFRKGLVVLQFAVTIALLIGTFTGIRQIRFMQGQDLGFAKKQVLVMEAGDDQRSRYGMQRRTDALKQELAAHPAVKSVSATAAVPGGSGWPNQNAFPGGGEKGVSLEYVVVDHDYTETLRLEMVAGRDFDRSYSTDAERGVIINEAAVEAAGWASPQEAIGKAFPSSGSGKPNGVVIGVVQNYHQHGLQEEVGPMMLGIGGSGNKVALRFDPQKTDAVQAHARQVWNELLPNARHETFFLDEQFAQEYRSERRLVRTFGIFAGLAVLIACLGLFGLAAFTAERRTKEIAVRKAMGASVASIVGLLSKDFLKLVALGFVVAVPLAWYGMHQWLTGFAYRIDLGPLVFTAAGLLALVVALTTVGYQALRAARTNPAQALRDE